MARNKYNATKITIDGHTFDSKKEGARYIQLKILEKAGEISDLKLQPKFYFPINGVNVRHSNTKSGAKGREITYSADFSFIEDGELMIEDTKGFATDVYKLKKALIEAIHGIEIIES